MLETLRYASIRYTRLITIICVLQANAQNQPPVAVDDSYSMNTNNTLTIPVPGILANDNDPEATALRVNPNPIINTTNGIVNLATDGSFTYTPNANFIGTDSFQYQVCDQGIDALVSQFDFDTNQPTVATVGPDATSINSVAVQSGCGYRIPSGENGGNVGLDVIVPNTGGIFGYTSFRTSFRYKDNEGTADIVSGGNFRVYHRTANDIGIQVRVIDSDTGVSTLYTLNLGGFGTGFNDYVVEYDEVTGDVIYTRNGSVTRTEIVPDNSPLDTTLVTDVIIGQFMDNAGRADPSLCMISITDTSKRCTTADVSLSINRALLLTNRRITYRIKPD